MKNIDNALVDSNYLGREVLAGETFSLTERPVRFSDSGDFTLSLSHIQFAATENGVTVTVPADIAYALRSAVDVSLSGKTDEEINDLVISAVKNRIKFIENIENPESSILGDSEWGSLTAPIEEQLESARKYYLSLRDAHNRIVASVAQFECGSKETALERLTHDWTAPISPPKTYENGDLITT